MGCYPKRMAPFSLVSPNAFSKIPPCIWSSNCTIMELFLGVRKKKVFPFFFPFLCFLRLVPVPSIWTMGNMPDPCSLSLTTLLGYALHGRKEQLARMWQWHGPELCSGQLYIMHLWNNTQKTLGQVNDNNKQCPRYWLCRYLFSIQAIRYSIPPDCMEASWLLAIKRRKSQLLLLVHQHVLKEQQMLNRYLRKTSIPWWACLFSVRSMDNTSAMLCLLRGTLLVVLKDTILPWGDVLQVIWDFTFNNHPRQDKKVRYLSLKLKQGVSVVCAFRDVSCVLCCPLLSSSEQHEGWWLSVCPLQWERIVTTKLWFNTEPCSACWLLT